MTETDLMAELDELAAFSDDPYALTRLYLSPSHKVAAEWVLARMRRAGMTAELDAAGTVAGRYEGTSPGLPAILLGSHIDTVRDAGKYDGNLGVMLAIAAVERLHCQGRRLPIAIEVLAFGDEEGVRFPNTFAGSKAVAGLFDMDTLTQQRHRRPYPRGGAARLRPRSQRDCPRSPAGLRSVLGYLEVHIEQGPVLESMELPLGVVTAISGASRFRVAVEGVPGHAGHRPDAAASGRAGRRGRDGAGSGEARPGRARPGRHGRLAGGDARGDQRHPRPLPLLGRSPLTQRSGAPARGRGP